MAFLHTIFIKKSKRESVHLMLFYFVKTATALNNGNFSLYLDTYEAI